MIFPFDKSILDSCLGSCRDQFHITLLKTTGSTNTDLKALGKQGFPEGTLLVTEAQTGGRGRMGRSFFSPPGGGLYFSLLVRPALPMSDALFLTTAAAVAVQQAICQVTGQETGIKWVNDLFLKGKKVCGILCEAFPTPSFQMDFGIIGIGLNVFAPEEGFGELASVAGALLDKPEKGVREALLASILKHLFYAIRPENRQEIANAYKKHSLVLGREVTVDRGKEVFRAKVMDIDAENRLVLQTEGGEIVILGSGEIRIRL